MSQLYQVYAAALAPKQISKMPANRSEDITSMKRQDLIRSGLPHLGGPLTLNERRAAALQYASHRCSRFVD
jgi:hypothetical protein